MIRDGAGWHQGGGELTLPGNIVLVPLPPYAPKLDPMENVWEYVRTNKPAGIWDSYKQILAAWADA